MVRNRIKNGICTAYQKIANLSNIRLLRTQGDRARATVPPHCAAARAAIRCPMT